MAIKKQVDIDVNAKNAIKSMEELGGSFEKVYGEVQPLSGRIGELEDRLYEMAAAGDTTSDEFKELTQEVGKMKKVIVETDLSVDAMSQTMAQNVGGALGGLTGAFELGQGAMGAFGVESEKVEEILLKVQSAMAISQGLQSIKESVPAFRAMGKAAMTALKGIKTGIAATGIGVLLVALGAVVANWEKITGFFDSTTAAQKALNETQEDYNKGALEATQQTVKVEQAFKLAERGIISKEEALETYNNTLGDALGKTNDLAEAEKNLEDKAEDYIKIQGLKAQANILLQKSAEASVEAQTAEMEDSRSGLEWFTGEYIKLYSFGQVDITERQKKNATERVKNEKEAQAEQLKNLSLSIEDEINALMEGNNIKDKNDEEYRKRKEEEEKRERQAANQRYRQYLQERLNIEREIEDRRLGLVKDNLDKELILIDLAAQRELEDLKRNTKIKAAEKAALTEIIEQERLSKIAEVHAKEEQLELEHQQRLAEQKAALPSFEEMEAPPEELVEVEAEEIKGTAAFAIKQKWEQLGFELKEQWQRKAEESNKEYLDRLMAQSDKSLGHMAQGLQALDDLNTALTDAAVAKAGDNEEAAEKARKKGFERSKKLQLAMAIITGVQGVMAAFTAGSSMGPAGVVMGPLMAALAAVTAAVNVSKIAKMKYEGGGASTGGGSIGAAPSPASVPNPANFNVVGDSGTNQLAESLGQQPPVQAYVVGSEVTTQQSLDRNKVETASI